MRGAWKPVAAGTTTLTVLLVGLVYLEDGFWSWWLILPGLIGGLMLATAYAVPAYLVVRRFLAGMEAAGADPRILEDTMGWMGKRTTRVRTLSGTWTLVAEGGRRWFRLDVTEPSGQVIHVRRNKHEAGEEMATRTLMGEPAVEPDREAWDLDPDKLHRLGQRLGPRRWTIGLLSLLIGLGLHLASARALAGGTATVPRLVLAGGLWLSLIVTGFTALFLSMLGLSAMLGGKRIVTNTGPPQPAVNGGMLTGVGAWILGVAGPWALSRWLYAGPEPAVLAPIGLGLIALGLGVLAARRAGTVHRVLMTAGSLPAIAAAFWLPAGEFFGWVTGAFAAFGLLLSWTGDVDPEELEALEEHETGS